MNQKLMRPIPARIPASTLRLTRLSCAAALAAFALVTALQAHAAAAPAAPDVILFTNGDQLTGKFLRSAGGNAVFHSDIAGDITVSWNKVKEIRSTQKFVVLQKSAQPARKALPTHPPEGSLSVRNQQIELTPAEGATPQLIPLQSVDYVIDQATFDGAFSRKTSFFSAWTGNVTGGASVVQATQNTGTFNAAVALVRVAPTAVWLAPRNRTSFDFQTSYGKITQPGTPTEKTDIYHVDGERDEYFSPRSFGLVQVAYDHNFSQSLDLQQIYGVGIGRTFIKQPKQTLDFTATVQYERQSFLDAAPGSDLSLIGSTFAANYTRKLPRGAIFNQQLSYIPAWNNMHAYSGGETNTLLLPVYKRLSFSVGTIDSYLNDPAVTTPPTKGNSFQFNMGVTYSLPVPH